MEFLKITSCILKYAMRALNGTLNHVIWCKIDQYTRLTSWGHEAEIMHAHASQERARAQISCPDYAIFVLDFGEPYLTHFWSILSEPKLVSILMLWTFDMYQEAKECPSHLWEIWWRKMIQSWLFWAVWFCVFCKLFVQVCSIHQARDRSKLPAHIPCHKKTSIFEHILLTHISCILGFFSFLVSWRIPSRELSMHSYSSSPKRKQASTNKHKTQAMPKMPFLSHFCK